MQSNDIRLAVQKIISENRINDTPTYSIGDFSNIDLFPVFYKLYSVDAYKVMVNRIHDINHQRDEFNHNFKLIEMLSQLNISGAKELVHSGSIGQFKRVLDRVNYFGFSCTRDQIPLAVERLAAATNDLASRGYITGALTPLLCFKFGKLPEQATEPDRFAIVSYIAVTQQGEPYVEQNMAHLTMREGEVPKKFEE